jgi:tetratricopeptide (TPR) repeat protein
MTVDRGVRHGLVLALLGAVSLGASYEWGGPAARGVRELKKGEHRRAIASLREGRDDLPRSAAVRYDQGLAYEGAGLPELARAAYREAAGSPELSGDRARSAAAFNLGNQAMRAQNYASAAGYYRQSLRVDPTRADAKKNLEEAIRRARAQQPQPQSGRGSPESRSQGRQNPSSGGSSGQPPSKQDQKDKQSPPSAQQQPSPQLGTSIPSRDEAEHWLDALESERQAARRRDRGGPEEERGQRDW